jgi:cobalt-zinc-cadmium efflux system outer membrane protein
MTEPTTAKGHGGARQHAPHLAPGSRIRRARLPLIAAVLVVGSASCAVDHERYDRTHLSTRVENAVGTGVRGEEDDSVFPGDVVVEDGIDETEAVAIALWNNAAFLEAITQLGVRRADLVAAGVLQNPLLSVFFPLGIKQLEFTIFFPIETLVLRPARVKAAELDCERVAENLVLGGLNLVRDVHRACADLRLARANERLAVVADEARRRAEELIAIRVREGEAAPLDLDRARVDRKDGERAIVQAKADIVRARGRLRSLLGLPPQQDDVLVFAFDGELDVESSGPHGRRGSVRADLLEASPTWTLDAALASRPDLRAAELTVDAARERAGISHWEWLSLWPLVDANGAGLKGFEIGPGLRAAVPLFDHGQGRSRQVLAQLDAAMASAETIRQQIALEVADARTSFDLAVQDVRMLEEGVIPAAEAARDRAEAAVRLGDLEPQLVLAAELRLVQARQQLALAVASLCTARAELERSCACPAVRGEVDG